jgi:hypothetical protein
LGLSFEAARANATWWGFARLPAAVLITCRDDEDRGRSPARDDMPQHSGGGEQDNGYAADDGDGGY